MQLKVKNSLLVGRLIQEYYRESSAVFYRIPAIRERLPTIRERLPTTRERLPATRERLPTPRASAA